MIEIRQRPPSAVSPIRQRWLGHRLTDATDFGPRERLRSAEFGCRLCAVSDRGVSPEATDFPAGIEWAPGKVLRVAPRDPKPYGHYDVLVGDDKVGALVLGGTAELARMMCTEGSWCLEKRRSLGWELIIESSDGQHVGWYSGRKWLPGGTISLTDGTRGDLRRSFGRRWKLQKTDSNERFLEIRRSGAPSAQTVVVTIRSLPRGPTEGRLLVLTSCAVLMLDRMMGFGAISSAQ